MSRIPKTTSASCFYKGLMKIRVFCLNRAVSLSARKSCMKFKTPFHYLLLPETDLISEKIQRLIFKRKKLKHNKIYKRTKIE